MHAPEHYIDSIDLFGMPQFWSGQAGEHKISHLKNTRKRTNALRVAVLVQYFFFSHTYLFLGIS